MAMATIRQLAIAALLLAQPSTATIPIHARLARRLEHAQAQAATTTKPGRPSYNLSVPIDHFHNETKYEPHSNGSFNLRYYLDSSHYKPGGPVILISCGEVSCTPRLPYMDFGIGKILAEATNGLTVLLEHRYYGSSYPVPDLSTENMRFLDTQQALADTAYFARNIQYPEGLDKYNLTSYETPYILYGGSYAGAFVALARKLYSDDFWGAISSSGVPQAIDDYWQYLEAFRLFGDEDCVDMSQKIIQVVDNVLLGGDQDTVRVLKALFDMVDKSDVDFAYAVTQGPQGLQETMWDPEEDRPDLAQYCAAITSEKPRYSSTRTIHPQAMRILSAAGCDNKEEEADQLLPRFLNWIGHTRSTLIKQSSDINFLSTNDSQQPDISIPQDMLRAWTYQTCTQWGYFLTGSSVPASQLPLISRLVDYPFATRLCSSLFSMPSAAPDTDSINRHGGFSFSHSRVAFVDGSDDPWRQAGPHAVGHENNERRKSTDDEPFILIEGAVHHWDEYGPNPERVKGGGVDVAGWMPPVAVARAQEEEVRFVKVWLEQWREMRRLKKEEENGEL